ncbi:receptor-like protein 12 [Tanacetum coccineum]
MKRCSWLKNRKENECASLGRKGGFQAGCKSDKWGVRDMLIELGYAVFTVGFATPYTKTGILSMRCIGCDNSTGHVHRIHLPGSSSFDAYNTVKEYQEAFKKKLRGDLSPSILNLPQLRHLDLSCNDFGGIQVPSFMGSFQNLRYLNLSDSVFGGTIPPQLGNVTELRILCLGSFYAATDECESTNVMNLQWLSRLRMLHHLDMSGVDLSKTIDWFQVINTLPSLVVQHLCNSQLLHIYPHVSSLNLTSLDISSYNFSSSFVPPWIFSQTGLVSLDLTSCGFHGHVSTSISPNSFHNLTSLKFLHVSGNAFMSSSLALEGLSMADTYFSNSSLTSILESFFECKSPSLESLSLESSQISCHLPHQLGQLTNLMLLQLGNNRIAGVIPESIGRLSLLRYLDVDENLISGPIPNSIGELSSLEVLDLSYNQLNGSLPDSLDQLSKLNTFDISYNLLKGIITEVQFVNLTGLNSWESGPQFPLWLQLQKDLELLEMVNTSISSTVPEPFWKSFSNLQYLDTSQNQIHGELFHIPTSLQVLDLSSNKFSGLLPQISNGSSAMILDLSNNSFVGLLNHLMCPCGSKSLQILNLAVNHLSGLIPECWMKWPNNFSGPIPKTLESLSALGSLNMCGNQLSGRLPVYVKNLKNLQILQLARNELDGNIMASDTLVRKGQEYTYSTTLGLVIDLDLLSNNFSGSIPRRIPEKIGDLKLLESFDVSLNQLSWELLVSLSSLTFLSSFNVSFNILTGRIPSSAQLQSFNKSSFIGNKLCGVPLTQRCGEVVSSRDQEGGDGSHGVDWGLIISILCGFAVGFWIAVAPLMVGRIRQIAPFRFVSNVTCMLHDLIH